MDRTFTPEDVDRFERLLSAAQAVVSDATGGADDLVTVDRETMAELQARVREISDAAWKAITETLAEAKELSQ